ncbi:MAG TPA: exodeoxyribonuclease VII large subunit [Methylomusa anaerophila]|uniref:Exodeoxyribonuclease 7 large subunit n=2 Tax=Methylomusa anaerophila TaxID=1930071 RepID=A0A348APC2_9FIRM|nr:exodeoxyribonuclease VII large subunit [Methylomusa anaerophila]BBB92920.1 exodeoxyribonuclease 7 large subunit [Methylomusa anaerophila]HML87245.1 exodeoxyribonuclease VII large subunit [Methylomusa anaerophila]
MSIYSVSEITKYIKNCFERDAVLASVFIRGEISNYKYHHSGHCYFSLKDASASIRCIMFRSQAQYLKFEPRNGLKVVAYGQISVFERDGQYQLYAGQLIPDGIGDLSLAFQQLKEKLANEGLFLEERKKRLPLLPKAVGVITSPAGAALRDIITVSKRRHSGIPLVLFPVQVQGPDASLQISQAIDKMNIWGQVDVIIVGRGGGSMEELWAFNEEQVVRAIAGSTIPIVAAVGHQTDYTLADFAADCRAATPSQAAELVIPDVQELSRYIYTLISSLEVNMRGQVKHYRNVLTKLTDNRVFNQPKKMLVGRQQLLDQYIERMTNAIKYTLVNKQHSFHIAAEKLSMLNPLAVLSRGYSITRNAGGEVIRSVDQIVPGQYLEIILKQGQIDVNVLSVKEVQTFEQDKQEQNF